MNAGICGVKNIHSAVLGVIGIFRGHGAGILSAWYGIIGIPGISGIRLVTYDHPAFSGYDFATRPAAPVRGDPYQVKCLACVPG